MTIFRRVTKEVVVGQCVIGGGSNISIQSMTNIAIKNVSSNVSQICELVDNGCEIVRLAVSSQADVKFFYEIKSLLRQKCVTIPLVADVHFSQKVALDCLDVADKVRINAGNFSDKLIEQKKFSEEDFLIGKKNLIEKLKNFLYKAKTLKKAVRIGINYGSLAPRIVYKFGNTPQAMWESAKECLEVASEIDFHAIVLSFKTSDVQTMIASNRLACLEMDQLGYNYPIHIGVTEAGDGEYGRIKSAIGIGTLLSEGIGDTIRISLTEDPVKEISVAKNILQACGRRRFSVEIISCPSCGRTSYNIQSVVDRIKTISAKLDKNLKIAVMGCVINGFGEAGDADFAIIGNTNGLLSIYKQKKCIKQGVTEIDICKAFVAELENKNI